MAEQATLDVKRRRVTPIVAFYGQCGLPEHDKNKFISALPAPRPKGAWMAQLMRMPEAAERVRSLPTEIRLLCVHRLKKLFLPDDPSLELAIRIDTILRNGLESRNPDTPALAELLQRAYVLGQQGLAAEPVSYGDDAPIASYSVFGVSGSGKTTTMSRVLNSYPQYIVHPENNHHQVVWLKVETPRGGGLRDLNVNILRAFDHVLGSDHATRLTERTSIGAVLDKVRALVVTHALGLLVIDEIQNLSVRKSIGREEVLNYFQELLNTLQVPVVLMGTPKARKMFEVQLRHNRRLGTHGTSHWAPLELGSTFDVLIEQLWQLLLLRDAGEISAEMKEVIYDETQGVRALMADMLLVTQLHALYLGKESITPEFFRNTARSEFRMVQPFIKALRKKEPQELTQYEDLCDYDLDELIERTQSSLSAAARSAASAPPATASYVDRAIASTSKVIPGGIEHARHWVTKALEEGVYTSAAALTTAAVKAYAKAQNSTGPM